MAKKNQPQKSQSNSGKSLTKLIEKYYEDLDGYKQQDVLFERGTQHAFHTLLHEEGKKHQWMLVAELEKKVNGKTIRPDGTFRDSIGLVRGFWEAKDSDDKLDVEIEKKRRLGYSFSNIIFEDTTRAVLFQKGLKILDIDMHDPEKLRELITEFFRYIEPEILAFEEAISEFKDRVPDLAENLAKKIADAHKSNKTFRAAFAVFFELCITSLNPNISQVAVDEMLIQHILTERLIREIFDYSEFASRNAIAIELEKVMEAMTSQSFNRDTYLKELDRFYVAIEKTARTLTEWSEKQQFLNSVYERFFQGYSVKLADTMGIVYTPQEIVNFMCASVAEVLKKEFKKELWSDDVYIIDPCTGTGNFIVNLIRRIPKAKLEAVYKHRLFANEIMLLPYYIAALNIEHEYWEQTKKRESFEGLCFVDTLDLAEHAQAQLGFMTAKNSERVERQRKSPITVVIGNPPYNAGQEDETDNNKNRMYPQIDQRIKETYVRANSAQKTKLYDPYVRFFRWATDRLGDRDGIVCLITNNSFVHKIACDGLQRLLPKEFNKIYHLDLRGDVRENPTLSGTAYNVFGIQVGVGITIAVRTKKTSKANVSFQTIPLELRREEKLALIQKKVAISGVNWIQLTPDNEGGWFKTENGEEYATFTKLSNKNKSSIKGECIFNTYSHGISTNRDSVIYDFDRSSLEVRAEHFADGFNAEIDRYRRHGLPKEIDSFLKNSKLKWSRNLKSELKRLSYLQYDAKKIRNVIYRPFTARYVYFDDIAIDERGRFPVIFPSRESENVVIAVSDIQFRSNSYGVMAARMPVDLHVCSSLDGHQVFPFYVYAEDGTNRRENITDWALQQFRDHYNDKKIDKWAIFYYVYGVLHHPGYREKFADNLKRELPRIPYAPDFKAFSKAGEKLAKLHLDYEKLEPWELDLEENPDEPLSYRVDDKMRLDKTKVRLRVNKSLTLAGIPLDCFAYRLGNRSALDWVIDQYQVHTDKRSGITSDPNREDDPEYIVKLVGQVIRVSIETMKIVNALPSYE
jgi:predicted helicase